MQVKNRLKSDKRIGVHHIFEAFVLLSNIIVFITLMLSTFSDRISPEKGMFFPYLGLLFPIIFIFNTIFLIYWVIRLRKYLLLSLIGLIISWHQIQVYFPLHTKSKNTPKNCIKILSYNVRGFNYIRHSEENPNPTIKYILEQNADIVCIQEFGWSKNDGFLDKREIMKAFKGYPYSRFTKTDDDKWHFAGLACFSKYPIIASHKINFVSKYNASCYYCIKIGDRKVDVINNHLESNKFTSDDILVYKKMIKEFNSNNLEDFNDIIIKKMDQAYIFRAKQAKLINEKIKKCKHDLIVCGDFNDSPISYAYRKIAENLKDAYVETGFGPGISYNENHFYFRIDHILHSPSLTAYNCEVSRIRLSDHYPISCYFSFSK